VRSPPGVFPAERHWLDFKRELYPGPPPASKPSKSKSRDEVHDELARDLASLAVYGGVLVFGVEEDKVNHVFTTVDMPLPAQLDQTIDQVARARITPPLYVAPTLLGNPALPGSGIMVVEVPESPDAPHRVGGVYYGRSETGKIQLSDDDVERLILQRQRRADQRLIAAMTATTNAVPSDDDGSCHMYPTAVPTRRWPDMFLRYTRYQAARNSFIADSTAWVNAVAAFPDRPADTKPAFSELTHYRRTQTLRGSWFQTFAPTDEMAMPRRGVGLGDDGTVRFFDLAAGSRPDGMHPAAAIAQQRGYPARALHSQAVVYDEVLWWDILDVLHLIAKLSATCGYHAAWLLGITVDGTLGRLSGATGAFPSVASRSDSNELAGTSRATSDELSQAPLTVAERLLRPVLQELGSEHLLRRLNPTLA
jgi:hypothetical protein